MDMAKGTDVNIKQKFEANKAGFQLLSKTRQDLASTIPVNPQAAQASQNPSVVAVKGALDELDAIKIEKEKVMKDGVAMHDSLNAVEKLMMVHQRTADKGAVFEEFKAKYLEHFAQNDALEKKKQEIT